jgi:hypothetical protein
MQIDLSIAWIINGSTCIAYTFPENRGAAKKVVILLRSSEPIVDLVYGWLDYIQTSTPLFAFGM